MGLRSLEIFLLLQRGIDFKRQNLTTKVDPRTVRVNPYSAKHDYSRFYSIFERLNHCYSKWKVLGV